MNRGGEGEWLSKKWVVWGHVTRGTWVEYLVDNRVTWKRKGGNGSQGWGGCRSRRQPKARWKHHLLELLSNNRLNLFGENSRERTCSYREQLHADLLVQLISFHRFGLNKKLSWIILCILGMSKFCKLKPVVESTELARYELILPILDSRSSSAMGFDGFSI